MCLARGCSTEVRTLLHRRRPCLFPKLRIRLGPLTFELRIERGLAVPPLAVPGQTDDDGGDNEDASARHNRDGDRRLPAGRGRTRVDFPLFDWERLLVRLRAMCLADPRLLTEMVAVFDRRQGQHWQRVH